MVSSCPDVLKKFAVGINSVNKSGKVLFYWFKGALCHFEEDILIRKWSSLTDFFLCLNKLGSQTLFVFMTE